MATPAPTPPSTNRGADTANTSRTFAYGPEQGRYKQTITGNGAPLTKVTIGPLFEVVMQDGRTSYRNNI